MSDEPGQGLFDNSLEQEEMSITEIMIWHQISRQGVAVMEKKENNSTIIGCFKIKNPNPYATEENTGANQEKSLQIKILDVLYNNMICSLVYMHDITSVIGGNR